MKGSMLALVIAVSLTAPATAQQPQDDPLGHQLFPPELVMSNQRAIALQDQQREAIMQAVRSAQAVLPELQMRMAGEMEGLLELLRAPAVDSAAALRQLDRVLAHEHQVKRTHIAMLIRIRNVLTPEQRVRLDAIRSGRPAAGY